MVSEENYFLLLVEFSIEGMMCLKSCGNTVQQALVNTGYISGNNIDHIIIDLKNKQATCLVDIFRGKGYTKDNKIVLSDEVEEGNKNNTEQIINERNFLENVNEYTTLLKDTKDMVEYKGENVKDRGVDAATIVSS